MIKEDSIIADILKERPEAANILIEFGMGCLGCPSSNMETLKDACFIHDINLDEVLKKLN
ncbi:DUF1858 domain-containing protein [uncultured Cetobacterium sp.]|uniref:DUF1858 domain-containing protein n=1 Tax=uncultured Cetobacterium sp. TaxID=527638 RepID=UPI002628CADB|nr:DUF1858 domain-containing protein [uncultured Cetobacterium sp.]